MNVRKNGVTDCNKHQTLVPEPSSSAKLILLRDHLTFSFYGFRKSLLKNYFRLFTVLLTIFLKSALVIFGRGREKLEPFHTVENVV